MRMIGLLAIGLVVAISFGCAASDMADDPKSMEPNMTADLGLGDSADSILSKYGKPLYKKGRMDTEGKKIEDWFYANAVLSFKDGNLNSFKPK
mgnify:FL=1